MEMDWTGSLDRGDVGQWTCSANGKQLRGYDVSWNIALRMVLAARGRSFPDPEDPSRVECHSLISVL